MTRIKVAFALFFPIFRALSSYFKFTLRWPSIFLSTGPMSRFSLQILNGALSTIFVRMSQRNKNKLVHFQSGQQKQNRIKLDCTGYFLVKNYHSMHLIHILQQKIIILICATYSSQQMSPLIQFNSYFVLDRWDLTNAFSLQNFFPIFFSL